MTDRTTYVIFHQPQTDLTKDISEHDLWIQTQQSLNQFQLKLDDNKPSPF